MDKISMFIQIILFFPTPRLRLSKLSGFVERMWHALAGPRRPTLEHEPSLGHRRAPISAQWDGPGKSETAQNAQASFFD